MTEKVIRTCDKCQNEIAKGHRYVNAGAYGAHFHESCINQLSAKELIVELNLDDIKVMTDENWQEAVKAPSYWRAK